MSTLRSSLNAQSLIFQGKLYVTCIWFCDFMYVEVQSKVKYGSCSSACGLSNVVYRYLSGP